MTQWSKIKLTYKFFKYFYLRKILTKIIIYKSLNIIFVENKKGHG